MSADDVPPTPTIPDPSAASGASTDLGPIHLRPPRLRGRPPFRRNPLRPVSAPDAVAAPAPVAVSVPVALRPLPSGRSGFQRPIYTLPISTATWRAVWDLYVATRGNLREMIRRGKERQIAWRVIRQAYNFGWPALNFLPLRNFPPMAKARDEALAELEDRAKAAAETQAVASEEAIVLGYQSAAAPGTRKDAHLRRRSAESRATRAALRSAFHAVRAAQLYGREVVKRLEDGQIDLPEQIDARTISMLARAASISSSALERAIKVERIREGKPSEVVGLQIGMMLENASPDELEEIQRTGVPSPRMLGLQAPVITVDDVIAREADGASEFDAEFETADAANDGLEEDRLDDENREDGSSGERRSSGPAGGPSDSGIDPVDGNPDPGD